MTFAKLQKKIRTFLHPEVEAAKLYEEIGEQRIEIKKLLTEYRELHSEHKEYTDTLDVLTKSMSAMIWKKDENHKYIFCNTVHCNNFFMFSDINPCLAFVKGKTDAELIQLIYRDAGVHNTFGEICTLSDQHTKKRLSQCHFFEAGKVADQEVLLYIIKTPLIDNKTKKFKGTIGIGWDMSHFSTFLIGQLKSWIYDGNALALYTNDSVFAYEVKPNSQKCNIFKHICPYPRTKEHPECRGDHTCIGCQKGENHELG